MDWKSLIPKGLELTLAWRGRFRFLDAPETERLATWNVVARVEDPVRFALSGRGELRGTFVMEPDVDPVPVVGRVEWFLQGRREVLHEGTFVDSQGVTWKLVGIRPLAVRRVGDGFGHLHCQLLRDETVVAVGVLSSGIEDIKEIVSSVRLVGKEEEGQTPQF